MFIGELRAHDRREEPAHAAGPVPRALGDGVVLARGLDGNVAVYPRETWEVTVEARHRGARPALAPRRASSARFFFSGAAEADLDKQGRVLVPAPLARHAGSSSDVVVAGNYDHLEIWNPPAGRST